VILDRTGRERSMDHTVFRQAIVEAPEEEAHRLVYADWLDDEGDSDRAEFIRAQVMHARLPWWDPKARALTARENVLLENHRAAWAGRIAGMVLKYTFCRGFIEDVALSPVQFLQHGEDLLALEPIRRVRLRSVHELEGLLRIPEQAERFARLLCRVPELDFNREYLGDTVGRLLLTLPELPQPRVLHLSHPGLSAQALEALGECPVLDRVVSLEITARGPGHDGLQTLLSSPRLAQLRHLNLTNAHLGDRGIGVLTSSPRLPQLVRLSLGHNGLSEPGVQTLMGALAGGSLEVLDLSFNPLGPAGLLALLSRADSARLPRLAALNLSRTHLGNTGTRLLAGAALLSQLSAVDLSLNRINDEGGRALAGTDRPTRLQTLDLIYNQLGAEVRRELGEQFGDDVCLFQR
jgi:uncharacterized protein (TIGR02996 family)